MDRTLKSKRLRAVLWTAAGGKCQRCGRDLPDNWHADHVIPWVKTHDTNVHDMQALCPKCNLRKGSRMQRSHQSELAKKIQYKGEKHLPLSILAWVVPGGGKSWLPGLIAQQFPKMKIAWFVPRVALRRQAVLSAKEHFGISLWESENSTNPSRGLQGFVATHAGLTENPHLYIDEIRRCPYIVVIDELHHAKINPDKTLNGLARAAESLVSQCKVLLMMSGTLETNDRSTIWGIKYKASPSGEIVDPEESADIYVRYTRETAIAEKAIVPIEFHHHDGPTRYINKEGEKNTVLSKASTRKEESDALFTALQTEIADELFNLGLEHWKQRGGKLIVVVDYQANARKRHKQLKSLGIDAGLAISEEGPEAQEAIKKFKEGNCPALVTVAMAYEGLDVPSVSHIICLIHYRSIPWIEQMFARAWRSDPGKTQCWAFVPDDPKMRRVIDAIRIDQPSVIGPGIQTDGAPSKPGERVVTVAIESQVDSIRAEMLDKELSTQLVRAQVAEDFKKHGLAESDPLIDQFVARILSIQQPVRGSASVLTSSDEAKRISKSIWGMCIGADRERGKTIGFHGQELHRKIGYQKLEDLSLEELKRVAKIAADFCS